MNKSTESESKPATNVFKRFCCGIKFFFTSQTVGKWSGRVLLAFFLLVIYGLFFPHTKDVSTPVDLQHAGGCPIPLPASAKNIQYYSKVHWVQYTDLVRFEAPVSDCLDHVQVVIDHWRDNFGDYYGSVGRLVDIESFPVQYTILPQYKVSWFDVNNITEGKELYGGGGSSRSMIWVDTRRGVFYYEVTD